VYGTLPGSVSDPDVIVQPETPLERAICADPAWRSGVAWGEPRSGHPEGTVLAHVGDVLANVDRVALDAADRERLRLAVLVHDAFKGDVDRSLPKTGENHHAMRARRFAERSLDDPDLLDVIELHDDAYLAWRHGRRSGDWDEAERRARAVLRRLESPSGERLGVYMRFYQADNETDGKTDEHRHWLAGLRDGLRLETRRLILIAAPAELLRALCAGDTARAEGLLGVAIPAGWPDAELAEILPAALARLGSDPATLGFGVWVVVARAPRAVVGSAGFIAPPDDGTIELGYGIHPDHRGIGYATEAATALIAWGRARPGVRRVIAECDETNAASIRVLEKAGMRPLHTRAGTMRWS
jgi:RimJ/RimL family protein N-acetyltransferase